MKLMHRNLSEDAERIMRDNILVGSEAWARNTESGLYELHERIVKPILWLDPTDSLLEVGVGSGNHLHSYKHSKYTGVDIDKHAIVKACGAADICSIPLSRIVPTVEGYLPFDDGEFNRVMAICSLHETRDIPSMLSEIDRVLAKGGRFVAVERMTAYRESPEAQERLQKMPEVLPLWFGQRKYAMARHGFSASYFGELLHGRPSFRFYLFTAVKKQ
jgi:ubiquinone/menaquinone biosynthesis C-methylase UbiE